MILELSGFWLGDSSFARRYYQIVVELLRPLSFWLVLGVRRCADLFTSCVTVWAFSIEMSESGRGWSKLYFPVFFRLALLLVVIGIISRLIWRFPLGSSISEIGGGRIQTLGAAIASVLLWTFAGAVGHPADRSPDVTGFELCSSIQRLVEDGHKP